MKQEETLAKWQEFCPYNQVKYGEDVALITGFEQAGKYPITVIKSNGTAECYDVKGTDLVPIGLDDAGKILKKLQPNKVTPFECVFSDKDEQNKVCMTFCNNFCSVIKNGEEIYSGSISEFHVLQNILKELFGYSIFLQKNKLA